jgi:hypothetical protein
VRSEEWILCRLGRLRAFRSRRALASDSMRDERWVGERLTAPKGDPVGVGQDGKVAMAVIGAIGHNPAAAR